MISRVSMLWALACVASAGCGTNDDVDPEAKTPIHQTAALSVPQIQAGRDAQLITGYLHPTFYGPVATFPFAGPDDPSVYTQAVGINDAGVVIGTTNRELNLVGGNVSSAFFVDAAGHQT